MGSIVKAKFCWRVLLHHMPARPASLQGLRFYLGMQDVARK